jgi:hypothetical protein
VVERVFVTGASGSGKSTLVRQIAQRTSLPIHDLDLVARTGGGRGPETSDEARADDVARILASGQWIAEGVHLGWTRPLLDAADVVVWLDHVSWPRSGGRVVRRFFSGALAEARRRRGRERFLRFSDYARKLRELFVSLPDARPMPDAEVEAALRDVSSKLVRCRSQGDIDSFLGSLPEA